MKIRLVLSGIMFVLLFLLCSCYSDSSEIGSVQDYISSLGQPSTSPHSEVNIDKQYDIPNVTTYEKNIRILSDSHSFWWNDFIFDSILYMDPDNPESIKGCLAESWYHSDDYLTWYFSIKENVYFSDNTICNADAICKFLDLYNASYNRYDNCGLTDWYTNSDNQLVLHLSAPCAWFETELCQDSFHIISPTAMELYGTEAKSFMIGTGPYYTEKGEQFINGITTKIELLANTGYHMSEKYPYFERFQIELYSIKNEIDNNGYTWYELANMLGEEKCDVIMISPFNYDKNIFDTIGFGHNIYSFLGTNTRQNLSSLWFNPTKYEPFMNFDVRKAISRFIDLEEVNSEMFDGFGEAQTSIWVKDSISYVSFDGFYFDPKEGFSLLADAGYDVSDISFTSQAIIKDDILNQISTQLTQYGIRMDTREVSPGIEPIINNREAINHPFYIGYQYGVSYGGITFSKGVGPQNAWHEIIKAATEDAETLSGFGVFEHYKFSWQEIYDPELYSQMCDLYDRMMSTPHWDEMVECSRELTRIVQEDYAALPLVQEPVFFAVREGAEEQFEALTGTSMFKWMYQ